MEKVTETEVLVVGAGNAAMSAAVAAREQGAKVVVLEKAPKSQRGGNSALTVHMRFPYRGMEDLEPMLSDVSDEEMRSLAERVGQYTESDYHDDIMAVTDGQQRSHSSAKYWYRMPIRQSNGCDLMDTHGLRLTKVPHRQMSSHSMAADLPCRSDGFVRQNV